MGHSHSNQNPRWNQKSYILLHLHTIFGSNHYMIIPCSSIRLECLRELYLQHRQKRTNRKQCAVDITPRTRTVCIKCPVHSGFHVHSRRLIPIDVGGALFRRYRAGCRLHPAFLQKSATLVTSSLKYTLCTKRGHHIPAGSLGRSPSGGGC